MHYTIEFDADEQREIEQYAATAQLRPESMIRVFTLARIMPYRFVPPVFTPPEKEDDEID